MCIVVYGCYIRVEVLENPDSFFLIERNQYVLHFTHFLSFLLTHVHKSRVMVTDCVMGEYCVFILITLFSIPASLEG